MALILSIGTTSWLVDSASAGVVLPDGRAWEMVSPLDKNGGDIRGIKGDSGGGVVQATADGEGVTYISLLSFGQPQGASLGSQYVARRDGGAGWASQNISIPMSAQSYPPSSGAGTPFRAFSPDLSSGLVWGGPVGLHGFFEGPALANSPVQYENYYLAGLPGDDLQPVLARAPSMAANEFRLAFLGATPDLKHAVFKSPAVLGTGAVEVEGQHNLYEWDRASGQFRPVNVLPNGAEESSEILYGGANGALDHAISEDGSKVVWTAETAPSSTLYVREGIGTSHPTTVQADAPGGNGRFRTASSDDSKIFFTDTERLTADSTASPGAFGDLYRFEPEAPEGNRLVDLTVDPGDPGGAEVLGVLGASADGAYVYFVANGVLDADPRASRGNCTSGSSPAGARCNLYLWHDGWATPRFVARLTGEDEFEEAGFSSLGTAYDWAPSADVRTARVSQDGNRVVFMSEASLTGYDNTVSTGGNCRQSSGGGQGFSSQCEEVYIYEASTNRLSCVSCNPSGARPIGPSGIPGGTQISNLFALYQSRVLSEAGSGGAGEVRVFFDSADALAPTDSNNAEDVYEYENGKVYLLSDGTSPEGASFVDASSDGNDVFFVTRAQLATQDTDRLVDLYDARAPHVPGERVGFPSSTPVVCQAEDCRNPSPAAPVFGLPASAGFIGAENVTPPLPTETKPKPRLVKKHKRAKRKAGRSKKRKRKGGKRTRAAVRKGHT